MVVLGQKARTQAARHLGRRRTGNQDTWDSYACRRTDKTRHVLPTGFDINVEQLESTFQNQLAGSYLTL